MIIEGAENVTDELLDKHPFVLLLSQDGDEYDLTLLIARDRENVGQYFLSANLEPATARKLARQLDEDLTGLLAKPTEQL